MRRKEGEDGSACRMRQATMHDQLQISAETVNVAQIRVSHDASARSVCPPDCSRTDISVDCSRLGQLMCNSARTQALKSLRMCAGVDLRMCAGHERKAGRLAAEWLGSGAVDAMKLIRFGRQVDPYLHLTLHTDEKWNSLPSTHILREPLLQHHITLPCCPICVLETP